MTKREFNELFINNAEFAQILSDALKDDIFYITNTKALKCNYNVKLVSDGNHSICISLSEEYFHRYVALDVLMRFIEDVINDDLDLNTLTNSQIHLLYDNFVLDVVNKSFYRQCINYIGRLYVEHENRGSIFMLPKYFCMMTDTTYYLSNMTVEEAVEHVKHAVTSVKQFRALEDKLEVFVTCVEEADKNIEIIQELTK